MAYIGAGRLDQPLEVLDLRETSSGVWEWVTVRRAWAQVEQTAKTNLFSKVGVGARDAAIVIRQQPLTLHQALRWKGQHLYLTSVTERDRTHLDAQAALVTVDNVTLRADGTAAGMTFPGVLTEKYARHGQEWPMSVNELGLVLVTPKAVKLRSGCLVEVRGSAWEVLVPHELDEYKNEYEIGKRADL